MQAGSGAALNQHLPAVLIEKWQPAIRSGVLPAHGKSIRCIALLLQLSCDADEFVPCEAALEAARHLHSDVAQELDVVIEREGVGVVRQRELLALKRYRLPEGGAELAGVAGV